MQALFQKKLKIKYFAGTYFDNATVNAIYAESSIIIFIQIKAL